MFHSSVMIPVAKPLMLVVAAGYKNRSMMKIMVTVTMVIAAGCSATVENVGIDSGVLLPAASLHTSWDKSTLGAVADNFDPGSSTEAGSTLDTDYVVVGSVVAVAAAAAGTGHKIPAAAAAAVVGSVTEDIVRGFGSKNLLAVSNTVARPFVDAAVLGTAVAAVVAAAAAADLGQGFGSVAVPKIVVVRPVTTLTKPSYCCCW